MHACAPPVQPPAIALAARSKPPTWPGMRSFTCANRRCNRLIGIENRAVYNDALVDRAVALGWSPAQVLVIDEDQGRSGSSAEGRPGFQRLVAEVGLDHVGLVLGIEMSRLARSSRDWYQLLEVCAVFSTLLADADGLYDPSTYNDRLLLGLNSHAT